jgi:hypothetical protein
MKNIFLFLIVFFLFFQGFALAQDKKKFTFTSINQIAASIGNKNIGIGGISIFSTNGLETKRWFAGLGIGYNQYALQTIPVYLQVERKFNELSYGLFVFANSGLNLVPNEDQHPAIIPMSSNSTYKYNSGFWSELGFGQRFYLFRNLNIQASVGYNFHTFKTTETIHPQIVGTPTVTRVYNEKVNAFLVRLGIRL